VALTEPITANDKDLQDSELGSRLARTWYQPSGIWGWLSNTHHTAVGKRFMVTSFIFFLLGGVFAALMRMQLIKP